ncbi:cilia- and flagella-associated protein 251 [Drosophila busckii]|uniref:cilia- and flagella-associated protein 251 n=1 Tax=Drosophila busckii TaxID=30019 RepID=UPI0014333E21|nr:cilia- and flagella-associated protein 251 [Drosophila busckii]
MNNAKKKSKSDQIPKPMSIKKEKTEEDRTLQPISHYIDDRLELVKQIFGTLKPKTIMNLAPEFLKQSSLDEIEEMCLNELLCVSTKRLKSIIEDTRCPTDTESSDDSDVEHKEEHISLEEISSDSDIGGSETRRAKKVRKSSAKRANDKTNETKEPEGQISVLELLELQARARAIRSQLAMEPITKIEVKSDDDSEEEQEKQRKEKSKEKRSHKSDKRKSSEQQATTNGTQRQQQEAAPQKRIKLKRNYRKTAEEQAEPVKQPPQEPQRKSVSKSRSASPDCVPITAETETLLISDSTDEDEAKQQQQKEQPKQPAAVELPLPAPEPAEESEPEEGEVRDEPEISSTTEAPATIEALPAEPETTAEPETAVEQQTMPEEPPAESELPKQLEVAAAEANVISSVIDDEDQNDDVISIGGDLEHEMIEEMSKATEEPTPKVKSETQPPPQEEEDNDVISLNTSEDESDKLQAENSESWRTRYLKSSKVSQVLATSRLGKRVRDKLRKSKRSQKHSESKEAAEQAEQAQQLSSQHEDGSMEQYLELKQQRLRKSSNSSKGDK